MSLLLKSCLRDKWYLSPTTIHFHSVHSIKYAIETTHFRNRHHHHEVYFRQNVHRNNKEERIEPTHTHTHTILGYKNYILQPMKFDNV